MPDGYGVRKFYMRLCLKGNTDVTYQNTPNGLEVTFEAAAKGGFKTLVLGIGGDIRQLSGYSRAEVEFFQHFLNNNRNTIERWAQEDA